MTMSNGLRTEGTGNIRKEGQTYKIADIGVTAEYIGFPLSCQRIAPSFQPFVFRQPEGAVPDAAFVVRYSPFEEMPADNEVRHIEKFDSPDAFYYFYEDKEDDCLVIRAEEKYGNRSSYNVRLFLNETPARAEVDIFYMPETKVALSDKAGRPAGNKNINDIVAQLRSAFMIAFSFITAGMGIMLIHSSTVIYDGRAYLFLGKSGTGKSTHSQSWLRCFAGCELLNDDNPVLRIDGKDVIVYGSPWSGKAPCYKQKKATAGAFVELQQAPYNKIEREDNVNAFVSLFTSISTLIIYRPVYDLILSSILKIVDSCAVPVYRLECLPDDAAANLCRASVVANKTER